MGINELIHKLRCRIADYRKTKWQVKEVTTHLNAIEIALALTDLGIRDGRPITSDERNWFRADLYLAYVFEGSDWEDILEDYRQVVSFAESRQYFKNEA